MEELDTVHEDWWVIKTPKGNLLPYTANANEQGCKDGYIHSRRYKDADLTFQELFDLGYRTQKIQIKEYKS